MSAVPTEVRPVFRQSRAMKKRQTVGDRIRYLRTSRRITQEVVADAAGVARSTYTGIEKSTDNPGRETLVAIADFFEASLDWIEGRLHKVNMPELGQFVKDPDKLALLAFWEALGDAQRQLFTDMLRNPPKRAAEG